MTLKYCRFDLIFRMTSYSNIAVNNPILKCENRTLESIVFVDDKYSYPESSKHSEYNN